ncbi:hypothetical protein NL108_008654 [Boleophthalmus pectinirostris]|nr:hypothetical protein NL108_008654 [Boleophthalmus pectinirostris]
MYIVLMAVYCVYTDSMENDYLKIMKMEIAAKSEPLPESVTWYSRAARLRTSSCSAPPLNEASLDTGIVKNAPSLLDTRLEASIQNVTSIVRSMYFDFGDFFDGIYKWKKAIHGLASL